MTSDDRTERFIRDLTDHQGGLFAYLVALLGDVHESRNVLQETNLVLWRKAADFVEGTDFGAWARTIAHYQVLAHMRDKKRDRHLFDEELLRQIAERPQPVEDDEVRCVALRHCLAELPDGLRLLISQRYGPGGSIREIAQRLGKTEDAVKVALSRIRQRLMHCIGKRLAAEGYDLRPSQVR
jgi:RNA polymerase sigma-70 factor (ECF subfamily)